jgi:hypothetical protein
MMAISCSRTFFYTEDGSSNIVLLSRQIQNILTETLLYPEDGISVISPNAVLPCG